MPRWCINQEEDVVRFVRIRNKSIAGNRQNFAIPSKNQNLRFFSKLLLKVSDESEIAHKELLSKLNDKYRDNWMAYLMKWWWRGLEELMMMYGWMECISPHLILCAIDPSHTFFLFLIYLKITHQPLLLSTFFWPTHSSVLCTVQIFTWDN